MTFACTTDKSKFKALESVICVLVLNDVSDLIRPKVGEALALGERSL